MAGDYRRHLRQLQAAAVHARSRGPVSDTLSIRLTGEVERSGTFVDFQDIDRDNIALTLRWQPAEWAVGHLVTEYVERRTRSNPGLPVVGTVVSNGVADIPRSRFLAEPGFSDLSASSPLVQAWVDFSLGGGWTLTPRLQYSQLKTPFTEIRVRGVEADDPTQVRRTGRIGAEDDDYIIAQLDLAGSVKTGPLTHRLLAGFEFDRERSTFLQSNFVSVPSINALNPVYLTARPETAFGFDFRQALNGYAVYFQDRIEITDAIELLGGVRQSWLNNDGYFSTDPTDLGPVDEANITSTTWQIGATWKLGHGFSLYTGYNTGFDVENVFGLRTVSGNPLPPETSNQVELGCAMAGKTCASASPASRSAARMWPGMISITPASRAIGDLRVRGVEIEGDWRPLEALTLSGGYAYLRGQITGSADAAEIGGRIADVPRSTGTVRATADLGHGLELRGGVSYVGSRAVANASAVSLDDYAVADIGLGYRWRRVRLDLSINNLANARFFTVANQGNANVVYPGDPRTVSGRIAVTW
ncbi:TonB-dependent receptor [Hankyongella ginsenosidimutans]|uniref:TonB-dependent receptor n=1 Tax=Hankyongella ginsenosidimutans TaxID=1763828 RepID=A0A4D7C1K7_9SPHN|nr:TonB-dependent receptor [Hankyongella ginsenosidimutans]QCI79604.1 TonB-dependent receptor [Hankyongella ginsenosidimutans]